jgi:uncharacterized protein YdeI (YjbR/CyaY-like superfamily)
VDQALCFGWIDGVRKSLDADSYVIRFTPRRPNSHWSLVNVKRVQELTRLGLMRPSGIRAFEARSEAKTGLGSYERKEEPRLLPAQERRFRSNRAAWRWFQAQPPWYRRAAIHWISSAKREETQMRRLHALIEDCERGRPVGPLRRPNSS